MATSAESPVLLDTSAAVALVTEDHPFHGAARSALAARHRGLAGHAAFETYSTLTRMPVPARMSAAAANDAIRRNFPGTRFLAPDLASELLDALPALGIAGGAVYDALVGGAARAHGLPLATFDRRAADIYRVLNVDVELLHP